MRRFVEGLDRGQNTLFPECLEDWIGEDNPVRVIDVFVDELDLGELGFSGVDPEPRGLAAYHPERPPISFQSLSATLSGIPIKGADEERRSRK